MRNKLHKSLPSNERTSVWKIIWIRLHNHAQNTKKKQTVKNVWTHKHLIFTHADLRCTFKILHKPHPLKNHTFPSVSLQIKIFQEINCQKLTYHRPFEELASLALKTSKLQNKLHRSLPNAEKNNFIKCHAKLTSLSRTKFGKTT